MKTQENPVPRHAAYRYAAAVRKRQRKVLWGGHLPSTPARQASSVAMNCATVCCRADGKRDPVETAFV